MAQTTNALSGRNAYVALSTNGSNFVSISGFAVAAERDGGERQTGSVHTADSDMPIVTAGKRDALTVKTKLVYTEFPTDPYTTVQTAYENGAAVYLRWAPSIAGGSVGFETSAGIVKTIPYVGVSDVANGEALMLEFDVLASRVLQKALSYSIFPGLPWLGPIEVTWS